MVFAGSDEIRGEPNESTNTLAQVDKALHDRYAPAIWFRCPNKSRIWERSK